MKLWIVGLIKDDESYKQWEFQGVFDDEQLAIAACKNQRFFIGPAELNKELPTDLYEWPGAYYPLRGN